MATNKAKRSIHLAQLERRSLHPLLAAKLMPVKAHVYRAIAELNGGLEMTLQELKRLQQVDFLPSPRLAATYDIVCKLRAQANRELLDILFERETANATHFERLSNQRQSKAQTPSAG